MLKILLSLNKQDIEKEIKMKNNIYSIYTMY